MLVRIPNLLTTQELSRCRDALDEFDRPSDNAARLVDLGNGEFHAVAHGNHQIAPFVVKAAICRLEVIGCFARIIRIFRRLRKTRSYTKQN